MADAKAVPSFHSVEEDGEKVSKDVTLMTPVIYTDEDGIEYWTFTDTAPPDGAVVAYHG